MNVRNFVLLLCKKKGVTSHELNSDDAHNTAHLFSNILTEPLS